jgi:hypothetical protein
MMRSRRFLLLTLLLAICVGCSDTSIAPLAGFWQGQFDGAPSEVKVKMRPEWTYKGYLQLYATGMKFKMHMESQAQIFDVDGTWSHKKNKIFLTPSEIKFDDFGGKLLQRPGVTPIDPTKVQDALGHPLVFDYSEDPQNLKGLEITFGPLLGRFDFTKGQE